MSHLKYIQDNEHYDEVLKQVEKVRKHLWIGTADIKDLYIKQGSKSIPFLGLLSEKITQKVSIRLIHAKEPGPNFRTDFDHYPNLHSELERVLCPRVHFKMIIFDFEQVYIGSANLTGAGLGMKSSSTHNFESGILTDIPEIVDKAINQFDMVWIGKYCRSCKRKTFCGDRIS